MNVFSTVVLCLKYILTFARYAGIETNKTLYQEFPEGRILSFVCVHKKLQAFQTGGILIFKPPAYRQALGGVRRKL